MNQIKIIIIPPAREAILGLLVISIYSSEISKSDRPVILAICSSDSPCALMVLAMLGIFLNLTVE